MEAAVSVEASGGDNGGDNEVLIKYSSKEGKPKSGDVSENVEPILCCVCSKLVLDSDTVVRCSLDDKQCKAVAHASCAGYTTRGASRAKFLCADHRASKLLQGSKSKTKSQSKGETVLHHQGGAGGQGSHRSRCCSIVKFVSIQ